MKLLVFDLDGTLLEKDGTLSLETLQMLKKLEEKNVRSTVATGRSLKSTSKFIEQLASKTPVILFNGARIFDPATGRYLYSEMLQDSLAQRVSHLCQRSDVSIFFFIDEDVYVLNLASHAARYVYRDGLSYHLVENIDFLQHKKVTKMVITGPSFELTEIENVLKFQHRIPATITRSEDDLLEILPLNVNKAEALKRLCKFLSIDLKEVVAFGNGENDLEMIKVAGTGVTFNDAPDVVKKYAKVILHSCGHLGLQEFFERFFQKG
ncbi:Cof-type HAD-IIB family hydrolase [Pseudothermotoga sp.]|uniref:Cof-type HAD-IIB family hydrolase n=1 Tax=Pseudothermotoga sp. TaxID=2033661 RepID=UPI0031F6E158